jgi:hypothetical protein
MKALIIIFLLIFPLFSCDKNSNTQEIISKNSDNGISIINEKISSSPLEECERIELVDIYSGNPDFNLIEIYRIGGKKELIHTIYTKTNFYYIHKHSGHIYFTINDDDLFNGLNDLWIINEKSGFIKNMNIKIGNDFSFSFDGKYLCYVYNDYGRSFGDDPLDWAFIPVVKLLDLNTGREIKYDFAESFLEKQWSAAVDIKPLSDRFSLKFSMDGGILGQGYILLTDKKFYQTK